MTKRRALLARVVFAAVTAAAGASSCAREPRDVEELVTLRMGAAMPILQRGSTSMNYLRTSLTRDNLVSSDEDGRAIPRLLESWEASPDGLTWRLRLREGVRFHDGSTVTSADIVPAIENLRTSIFAASQILSARAVDAQTIEVRLSDRSAFFLEDLAAVFPEKVVGNERFGTGPFVVESQTAERSTLRAFPQYYRGRPEIDRVEIDTYPDLRNAWSALMRNEIDFLYELSREAREFVEAESSVQVSTFLRPYVILLGFNPSRPQFRSVKVRQALNAAIDRPRLVREALRGQGEPATSHVWVKNWAFHPSAGRPDFSPAAAIRLLDESGLRRTDASGQMPARLRFKVMVYSPLERVALALQRQLAQLDIDMQIEIPPTAKLVERMTTGDFDAFLFEMSAGRSLKWGYLFWHSKGGLRGQFGIDYNSADETLDRMRRAPDDDAVRAAVADFQDLLATDPPAAFLAWGELARASSRRFEIPTDGEADVFASIWRWKPLGDTSSTRQ